MTKINNLGIGSKVEISYLPINKPEIEDYASKIIDIEGDDIIHILNPMLEGQIRLIPLGAVIDVIVYRNDAVGGIVSFTGEVVNRVESNINFIKVKIISKLKKIQRREFYRLPIITKVHIRKLLIDSTSELNLDDSQKYDVGVTKDLSGGGMSVASNLIVDKDDIVAVKIFVDNNEVNFIFAHGKVLRTQLIDTSAYKYEIGIQFESITETARENLIQYIFVEQRKLRQKGMI